MTSLVHKLLVRTSVYGAVDDVDRVRMVDGKHIFTCLALREAETSRVQARGFFNLRAEERGLAKRLGARCFIF